MTCEWLKESAHFEKIACSQLTTFRSKSVNSDDASSEGTENSAKEEGHIEVDNGDSKTRFGHQKHRWSIRKVFKKKSHNNSKQELIL